MEDKQQVRVRYVKDMLAYEDVRFAGHGLIEYFLKPDQAFVSRDQQCVNSHYLVAQTNQDQYLYIYKNKNLVSFDHQEEVAKGQEDETYNHDFVFEIIKVRHKNFKKKVSR